MGIHRNIADIEGSKSDVAMNAWPPQASYPCGCGSQPSAKSITPDIAFRPLLRRLKNQDLTL